MNNFEELVARWDKIKLGEEVFEGEEGDAASRARAFYQKHLEPLALERMRAAHVEENSNSRDARSTGTLVSMVGFSPTTSITAAFVLRPERLVLIHTRESKRGINTIMKSLISDLKIMDYDQITTRLCEASDPVHIYEVIREVLDESRELAVEEEARDAIDITGGKKVMSAASALVAWQLGLEICYTDSRYDPITKTPAPGSEEFVHLGNPLVIFGDQELEVARELFNEGNHSAAASQFRRLGQRIRSSEHARFCATLSSLYSDWCAFRFDDIEAHITHMNKDLDAGRSQISVEQAARLRQQFDYLRSLRSEDGKIDPDRSIINFILLARHYHEHDRRDFAAMLYYRAFEAAAARRLLLEHHIDAGAPDLSALSPTQRERFEQNARAVFNVPDDEDFIPSPKFGFMLVMILLFALEQDSDDAIMKRATLGTLDSLKSLRSTSEVRNASILAHGHAPIPEGDLKALIFKSERFTSIVWDTIYPDEPFEQLADSLRFLTL